MQFHPRLILNLSCLAGAELRQNFKDNCNPARRQPPPVSTDYNSIWAGLASRADATYGHLKKQDWQLKYFQYSIICGGEGWLHWLGWPSANSGRHPDDRSDRKVKETSKFCSISSSSRHLPQGNLILDDFLFFYFWYKIYWFYVLFSSFCRIWNVLKHVLFLQELFH